jgi:hypothetical protein
VLELCARVDVHSTCASLQRFVREQVELGAGDDALAHVEPRLPPDRERCSGVIAGDHHDPNPGRCAFRESGGDVGAQRIREANEAEQVQLEAPR